MLYSKYRIIRKIGSRVYLSYIPMQNHCQNVEQSETQKKKIIKKKHTTLTPTVALLATVALVNYFIGFCSTLQKWTGKGISTCVAWVLFLGHSWCRAGYSTMTTRQLYSGVVGDRVGNHITPSLIPSSPLPSPPLEVCWWLWLWSLQESSLCHKRPKFINFHLHQ